MIPVNNRPLEERMSTVEMACSLISLIKVTVNIATVGNLRIKDDAGDMVFERSHILHASAAVVLSSPREKLLAPTP